MHNACTCSRVRVLMHGRTHINHVSRVPPYPSLTPPTVSSTHALQPLLGLRLQVATMNAAWDIYAKQLIPLRFGYPLWGAEPDSRFGEVQLGDVGYLREGHFCFLFNAMAPATDPRNLLRGVPDNFKTFCPPNPEPIRRLNTITQHQLKSRTVRSNAVKASVSAGCAPQRSDIGFSYSSC